MLKGPALENVAAAIADACASGLGVDELRAEVLPRLRRAVPVDALWWATVDPATLLFTRTYTDEIPAETGPYFVQNEYLGDDVNKWVDLARDTAGTATLFTATGRSPEQSARYRDIFEPLGLGDELRTVLRSNGVCWGYLCLHREGPQPFSADEAAFVQRIAPVIADGIRLGLLIGKIDTAQAPDAPGLLLLTQDGSLAGTNAAGAEWLAELTDPSDRAPVPLAVLAVAAKLREGGGPPRLRVRTHAGRWAVLHASRLEDHDVLAVIVETARPLEIAPILMAAYRLTDQERRVTSLVCRGRSTNEIAAALYLSANTVQDHLKSIFDKVGVRSRRELVATILEQQYLPRVSKSGP
jgi:DNA-binding CsgD family transcriptional regulator